ASVSQRDRHKSLDAGGNDFLPKPVNAQKLFKMLDRHLGIKWKYAQTKNIEIMSESSTSDVVIDNPQILSPPLEELEILLALVQRGRLNKLSIKAQQIQQSNQKYIPFIKPILQWTKDFEADKIEEFIQSFLEQKE
ncbi:MAG: two-component system sensor histidine kinase/response regulator, partial [Okeania sp. SIO2D1]|nr:two-component system sensor histidine kinase/response regulator [Okeania sp. SIO2D1]